MYYSNDHDPFWNTHSIPSFYAYSLSCTYSKMSFLFVFHSIMSSLKIMHWFCVFFSYLSSSKMSWSDLIFCRMVTKHFCFPLFLPVQPSELWEVSSKSSVITICSAFLLHLLLKVSTSDREVGEENLECTRQLHPLWPLGWHGSTEEKQTRKLPNILHLRTLLKEKKGNCLALRTSDLTWMSFLICQLNRQENWIIQKKIIQARLGN